MTRSSTAEGFVSRPGDPERWIKAPETRSRRVSEGEACTARLTIDVTPALRGRLKVAAFHRGVTVADMLREILLREFPPAEGGA